MANNLKLLVFNHGGVVWALPVGNISEVIVEPKIFPVPQPRKNVSGLAVYRGNPALALTLKEDVKRDFIYGIVIHAGEQYKVLLNDEPGLLLDIDAKSLAKYEGDFWFVRSTVNYNGENVLIIDPRRIIKGIL